MSRSTRAPVLLTLLSTLVSLLVIAPSGTANAAESVPALQWPAVGVHNYVQNVVTSPNGNVTVPCIYGETGNDLITYNASGQVV